jgi:hypothetical protein
MTQTLRSGSSIVCGGPVGAALRDRASRYPEQLFAQCDADLQAFAREAQNAQIGVTVPPVLSIVLSRCGSRDEIVRRLLDLREEWKEARDRMWARIEDLQRASPADVREITRELEQASELLSPSRPRIPILPSRVLWDLVALSGALYSGNETAATIAVVGRLTRSPRKCQPLRDSSSEQVRSTWRAAFEPICSSPTAFPICSIGSWPMTSDAHWQANR